MDIMGPLKSSSLHLHICYKHNPKPLVIIKLARAHHWGNSPSNLSLFLAASIKPELPVPRLFISQHKPTNPPTSAQIINRGRNSVYSCVSWSLKHVVRLPLSCCSLFVTNKHIDPRTNSAVSVCLWRVCDGGLQTTTWAYDRYLCLLLHIVQAPYRRALFSQHPHPLCWATIVPRKKNNLVWCSMR